MKISVVNNTHCGLPRGQYEAKESRFGYIVDRTFVPKSEVIIGNVVVITGINRDDFHEIVGVIDGMEGMCDTESCFMFRFRTKSRMKGSKTTSQTQYEGYGFYKDYPYGTCLLLKDNK